MHKPRRRARRISANIGFRPHNVWGLERLEHRLTLSHTPAPGAFEVEQFAPHESAQAAPSITKIEGTFSPMIGGSSSFGDGGFGMRQYSPSENRYISAAPPSSQSGSVPQTNNYIPPAQHVTPGEFVFLFLVTTNTNDLVAANAAQSYTPSRPQPASSPATTTLEFRGARFAEPPQISVNAPSESRSNSGTVPGNGGESQAHAVAIAETVREVRAAAPPALTLPPQVATPMNAPADATAGRIATGQVPPQAAPLDAAQVPTPAVPQGPANTRGLGAAAAAPAEQAEHVVQESVSEKVAAAIASLGSPAEEMISMASARAALLASLPLNMEAVDDAVAAMMSEVGKLGDEFALWLDESSVPPWALTTAVVVACGIGVRYVRRSRRRRSNQEELEEESSNWLFTRLQSPVGQV